MLKFITAMILTTVLALAAGILAALAMGAEYVGGSGLMAEYVLSDAAMGVSLAVALLTAWIGLAVGTHWAER